MIYNEKEYKIVNCNNETKRSRYWCILLYPDSCNPEWYDLLYSLGIKCAISPIHDRDIHDKGEKKGELKKPHYHILVNFGYGARLSDIASICDTIGGSTHVQLVKDVSVMHDYLTHKNNPEKAQYSPVNIKYINSERYDYVNSEYKEILNFIDEHECKSFQSLCWVLRQNYQDKLLEYVSKNCYYVKCYIDSRNNKMLGHIQNMLEIVTKMLDNIEEDIKPDIEAVKTIRSTINQYRKDYDDLPF